MRNNRIIIAEDDELAGELLKKILVTEGYDVMLFPDGAQALRWYCDNPCPVVLTDLAMPAMSGGSLIDAIKEINENQVILVVTSYSDPATIIKIMKKGVYDYIIKPIDQNILIDSVKKAFEAAKLRSLKKTVENKQHDSCSFLCKVFNGASHAIVAIDDNTNIVAYNQAAEILFQRRKEELVGKPLKSLFTDDTCCGYEIIEELLLQEAVWKKEIIKAGHHLSFRRNDGRLVITEVVLKREMRGGSALTVATFHDVTERKNEEFNLKKSNEKFTKLFRNNPEGMIIIRISDSIIMDVNESLLKLSGFSRGEMIGKKPTDLGLWVNPEDRLRVVDMLLCNGNIKNYECSFRIKDGSIKWGNFSVVIVEIDGQQCYLTTIIDISERKKIEELNLQYLKTLELLIDISTFFISLSYDDFENMLRIALEKICSIMNADRCRIVFFDFMKQICVCHYDWWDDHAHMVEEKHKRFPLSIIKDWIPVYQRKDIVVVENVEEMERADQKEFFLSQNIKSLMAVPMISNGVPIGFVQFDFLQKRYDLSYAGYSVLMTFSSMIVGVMQKWQSEKNIRSLLDEKDALIREVHHRIKNNINAIISMLSLQLDYLESAEIQSVLNDTISRFKSMSVLYDFLYRSTSVSVLSLKEYVNTLVEKIREIFFCNHHIVIQITGDDVILDAKRMSYVGIVITELITNAIKYAFDGMQGGRIAIMVSKEKNTIKISVCDNGKGIPEYVASWDEYGFGLRLVSMMAKQLKGILTIERAEGTKIILEFDYSET